MSNWWADKLGTQPQAPQPSQQRPSSIPMPPSQQPMTRYTQPQQPPTTKAVSANQTQLCPECGGNNYMSPNPQQIAFRCYDCGYPIGQSGSRYGALSGARTEGSSKPAIGNSQGAWSPIPAGYNPDGSKQ